MESPGTLLLLLFLLRVMPIDHDSLERREGAEERGGREGGRREGGREGMGEWVGGIYMHIATCALVCWLPWIHQTYFLLGDLHMA